MSEQWKLPPSWLDWVAKSLLMAAVPFGVAVWWAKQFWPLTAIAVVSQLAVGAMLLFRRDLLAVFSIMLGWMGSWVALFFAVFGDWPGAALWGGSLAVAVVAVHFVGRLFQKCEWRQEAPFALYMAAAPTGCVFWGAGLDLGFAGLLGYAVGVAGFWVAFFNKDWINEGS